MMRLASRPLAPRAVPVRRRRIAAAPTFAARLVVMVKEPSVGRVKTRLARDIGSVQAAAAYRNTLRAVLARLHRPGRWRTELGVTPDSALSSAAWPKNLPRRAQGRGDLGRRMQRLIDKAPPGPVLLIGSDVPTISSEHIDAAVKALGTHDAVFGPSPDGGYWLVGLKRRPRIPRAFASVPWSTNAALEKTVANLAGLDVARVASLPDLDQAADLRAIDGALGRVILPVRR